MGIYVWWIGERAGEDAVLEQVRAKVAREFDRSVALWHGPQRPHGTFDPHRRQHSSRALLAFLVGAKPADATRIVGLTDVDLFIPVLTFVFGEAQLEGPAAVVSTARLVDPASAARTDARVVKECVHELGHTFGLTHCAEPRCVMARSASVRAVDGKAAELCGACRVRYRLLQQDGLHVYREYENTGR